MRWEVILKMTNSKQNETGYVESHFVNQLSEQKDWRATESESQEEGDAINLGGKTENGLVREEGSQEFNVDENGLHKIWV